MFVIVFVTLGDLNFGNNDFRNMATNLYFVQEASNARPVKPENLKKCVKYIVYSIFHNQSENCY